MMGVHDSSLMRVKPIFEALYASDPTGGTWLSKVLALACQRSGRCTTRLGALTRAPQYEFRARPPRGFLRYLLSHADCLSVPPARAWLKWSQETQAKRRALLASDPETRREALELLDEATDLACREWWRLEGVTSVDCALFTTEAVIFIEGKWTEKAPSRTVTWWGGRNQVIRNLECARTTALRERVLEKNGHLRIAEAYALVIAEEDLCGPGSSRERELDGITDPVVVARSLPHLDDDGRALLMRSFLGWTTWQAVSRECGLPKSWSNQPEIG